MTVGETNQSRSAADLIKRDDALLPCPFCGGKKNTICRTDYDGRDAYAVSCRYPECHGAIFTLGLWLVPRCLRRMGLMLTLGRG